MRLAVLVVYMVKEENEALLDLHLRQIRLCTSVPYTIYANVNKLLPKLRSKLEAQPDVKVYKAADTSLRATLEHSYYLENLIQAAIDDEVSHIVILHADSFPVQAGWAEALAEKIKGDSVLVTVSRKRHLLHLTSCLFFSRDFYLRYRPSFLISDAERRTDLYDRFCKDIPLCHPTDSGMGFAYKAYAEGLSWHLLERSNVGEDGGQYFHNKENSFGNIYGDLMFHLEGAYRLGTAMDKSQIYVKLKLPWLLNMLIHLGHWLKKILQLGGWTKKILLRGGWTKKILIKRMVNPPTNSLKDYLVTGPTYNYFRKQLLENPDAYLQFLRTGKYPSE